MSENSYNLLLAGCHRDCLSAPRHSHNGVELVWCDRGRCTVEFDGNGVIPAEPGQLYITPPRLIHSQQNTSDCVTLYAVMMIDAPECDDSLRLLDTNCDPMLQLWFRQLPELYENGSMETASRLLAVIWSRIGELERDQRDRQRHPALAAALTYLARHYMQSCPISELAQLSGVSTSHLNLLFHRQFNMGPRSYLTQLRMVRARQLLANPYWNIGEVAARVGYSDPNYFSRKFHAFHRQTPLECRRILLSADWAEFLPNS